jgi:glycerophosphoryl diester phosphodiesterase
MVIVSYQYRSFLALARLGDRKKGGQRQTGGFARLETLSNTDAMKPLTLLHDFKLGGRIARCALLALGLWAPAVGAFDLQGHRGARGLAPENTLAAFERALEIGVTTLELDIAITADGIPVISHEPALFEAITRDAQGRWLKARGPLIKSLTLAQVQAYDVGRSNPDSNYGKQFPAQVPRDGQRIPTLASLFKLVKDAGATDVQFDIETKVYPSKPDDTVSPEVFVNTLLAAIREAGMTRRVMVQSFDWRTLQLIQTLEPGLRTVYLTSQSRNYNTLADGSWTAGLLLSQHASVAHMVKASGGTTWAPNFNDVNADVVKGAQALGLNVVPWTVNNPPDMERLLDWGVDGIISDYPDRLRDVMRQRGMVLPKGLKN